MAVEVKWEDDHKTRSHFSFLERGSFFCVAFGGTLYMKTTGEKAIYLTGDSCYRGATTLFSDNAKVIPLDVTLKVKRSKL